MPPVTPVTDGGFSDEPAMAAADDGAVYVAYNCFRDGADSLQVARYRPQAGGFEPLGNWQAVGGKETYVLGPRAVSAGANVTDRGDWSEHDNEEGFGSGVGGGWRRYGNSGRVGFFWGGRVDLWSLEIDWEDDSGEECSSRR